VQGDAGHPGGQRSDVYFVHINHSINVITYIPTYIIAVKGKQALFLSVRVNTKHLGIEHYCTTCFGEHHFISYHLI
jgi:hypothetical protein